MVGQGRLALAIRAALYLVQERPFQMEIPFINVNFPYKGEIYYIFCF